MRQIRCASPLCRVRATTTLNPSHYSWCALCRKKECAIMDQCLGELAERYPATKFLKIRGAECIQGYPEANMPTLLLYTNGKCQQTLVGLERFGGEGTSPDLIAISLNQFGAVCGDPDDPAVAAEQLAGVVAAAAAAKREGQPDDEESLDD